MRAKLLADLPQGGSFIETRGATLHYLSKNAEAGKDKPVFDADSRISANAHDMMLALGDELAAHGTVLSFDRPGIGRSKNKLSDKEMSDPRAQAEIHQAVQAMGYEMPVIIGQSWGGSTALAYAQVLGEEIAASVMLAPPIIPWYGPDYWANRLVTLPIIGPILSNIVLTKYGAAQLQAGSQGAAWPETTPQNYVRDAAIALILQPRAFRTNAVYAMNLKHHLEDMQKTYKDMPGTQSKLLIIHGDKDRTVNIDYNAPRFWPCVPMSNCWNWPVLVICCTILGNKKSRPRLCAFWPTAKPRPGVISAANKANFPCHRLSQAVLMMQMPIGDF